MFFHWLAVLILTIKLFGQFLQNVIICSVRTFSHSYRQTRRFCRIFLIFISVVVLQSHHRNLVDKQMKILLSSFIAGKEESPKFSQLLSYKSLLELNWYPNYPRHEVQIHQITCPTTTLLNIQILKIIVLLKVSLLLNLGINAQLIWEKACISHVIPTWLGGEGELRKPPPHPITLGFKTVMENLMYQLIL